MAARKLDSLEDGELLEYQQSLMEKRGEAERGFREQQQAVQFEMDKRDFKRRLGRGPTPAEIAAMAELQAEASSAESEE